MTDEVGRMIALAVITQTELQHTTDLFKNGVITLNDYKNKMKIIQRSLAEQTMVIGGIK